MGGRAVQRRGAATFHGREQLLGGGRLDEVDRAAPLPSLRRHLPARPVEQREHRRGAAGLADRGHQRDDGDADEIEAERFDFYPDDPSVFSETIGAIIDLTESKGRFGLRQRIERSASG